MKSLRPTTFAFNSSKKFSDDNQLISAGVVKLL